MRSLLAHAIEPLALLAALGVVLVCSCGDDECVCPKDESLARDTPQHLITSFCDVLEARNVDQYSWCLDDDYRFTFLEQDWDAAGVTDDVPYWEKCRDVTATTHMFRHSQVASISCDLPIVSEVSRTDTLAIYVCDTDLQVTVDMGGGEPTTYWAHQTWLTLTLARDRSDPYLWVIRAIEETFPTCEMERSAGGQRAVEHSTFGTIKAMCREERFAWEVGD